MDPRIRQLMLTAVAILAASLWVATAQAAAPPGSATGAEPDVRASRLIGMPVHDRAGRRMGRLQELLVDTREGRVTHVVIEGADYADIGSRRFVLPFGQAGGTMDAERIVLDLEPREVDALPAFAEDAQGLRRASRILAADLRDRDGRDVGDVKDFVLGLRTGRIRYAVAEFDPSWYRPGRWVLVPVHAVATRPDGDDLELRMDRAALREAPGFERGRWPDLSDAGFRARFERFAQRQERVR